MDDNTLFQPGQNQQPSQPGPQAHQPLVETPTSPVMPQPQQSQPVMPSVPSGTPVTSTPSVPSADSSVSSVSTPVQPIQQASPVPPVVPSAPSVVSETVMPPAATPVAPVSQSFTAPAVAPTPVPSADLSVSSVSSGPRFSLEDLYGPSQPASTPPAPSNPVQQSPVASSLTDSPVQPTTPLQDIPLASSSESPATQDIPSKDVVSVQQPTTVPSPSFQQPQPATPIASSSPSVNSPEPSLPNDSSSSVADEGSGSFHFPPFLKYLVGGIVALLVLLLIVTLVSSLFKGSSGNGKVTLTYWGLWEDSRVMQNVLSDFERQHPNITVTYMKEDPKDYPQRLLTRIQNGTGPDIFRFHNTWVTPLQHVLLPLPSSVVTPQQLKDVYYPTVSEDLVRNGALYGLPLQMDTLALYTNKAIFDHAGAKVPTTWDQFITAAKALTVKDPSGKIKTAGASIGTYENVSHAPDIASLLLLQNGASLQALQGSQNATDALTFYTSFAKGEGNVWDNTLDTSMSGFAKGNVAMYFGYSWDILAIQALSPTLQFEVHPVPHLSGRDMTISSYWVEGVSSRSPHPKEALLLMQYLAQKDTQTKLYTEEAKTRPFGELYARSDLAQGLTSNPLLSPFVMQASTAHSSFFAADTNFDSFNGSLNRYLGNAINALLGNTSADTAIATLAQGVAQVFNQYATPTQ